MIFGGFNLDFQSKSEGNMCASSNAAWISIKEISQMCHIGQVSIRNLIAANAIPHLGLDVRFSSRGRLSSDGGTRRL